jgi:WD40 repeat protein
MIGTIRHILTGHTAGVWALEVAPDGSWLASAGDDGELRIWDPTTGAARHILTGHTSRVRALAVAPDGSWLASAGYDREVRTWDPVAGTARQILTGHPSRVWALRVAPDGSWLASAGDDGELRIWKPIESAGLTSLRVAGGLLCLELMSTTVVAAGVGGLYFLRVHRHAGKLGR